MIEEILRASPNLALFFAAMGGIWFVLRLP